MPFFGKYSNKKVYFICHESNYRQQFSSQFHCNPGVTAIHFSCQLEIHVRHDEHSGKSEEHLAPAFWHQMFRLNTIWLRTIWQQGNLGKSGIIEQSFFTTDYASNIYDRPHISAALSFAVTDWQVVGQQGKLMRLVKGSLFSYLLFMVYVSASSIHCMWSLMCRMLRECSLLRLAWQSWPNLKTSPHPRPNSWKKACRRQNCRWTRDSTENTENKLSNARF